MVFDGFCGFGCFLVVLVVLAVAGAAPWGTPCHHILMVFDGSGGLGCFFCFGRSFEMQLRLSDERF
jgi:hypothetical protein